jgi:hypothetical protein
MNRPNEKIVAIPMIIIFTYDMLSMGLPHFLDEEDSYIYKFFLGLLSFSIADYSVENNS